MKIKSHKLNALCVATTIALGSAAVPTIAAAGASASVGVANMYLWRGQNLTQDGAQVHGGIEFSSETGLYGGVWTTTETGGHETDLYVGFGGSVGDFGYDISYWSYQYPEDGAGTDEDGMGDQDFADLVLSGSYGPVTVAAYLQMEAPTGTDDEADENNYYTISGDIDKFSITYGMWDLEDADSGDEYSHLTVMYSATDEVTVGISKAFSDADDDEDGVEEDPLFYVGYDLSFDL